MAQPTPDPTNGVPESADAEHAQQPVAPGKRKREQSDEGDTEMDDIEQHQPATSNGWPQGDQKELVKAYIQVLSSFDISPPILKRPIPQPAADDDEPEAKRQKSAEPESTTSISDKAAADAYRQLDDVASDLAAVIRTAIQDLRREPASGDDEKPENEDLISEVHQFKEKALQLLRREKAYPQASNQPLAIEADIPSPQKGELVLSLIGYAPQERRLFSSLPVSHNEKLAKIPLPQGVSLTHVVPTTPHERTQTLGELFPSPRGLPPLQPPKQPKTQAKGNMLDFYHPELTDTSKSRGSNYFTTKLSAGYYLDYSNATPSSQTVPKQRERAESLAGKKPSTLELEMSEMDSLFRGAFSSFAPCKDDAAAIVPSSVAGRMWWQRSGQRHFQNMIEVEYYSNDKGEPVDDTEPKAVEVDEDAIQEALNSWDETMVDPSLDDIMGTKESEQDREADEILEEVSDMIQTLASYQRIRNLTLPNSQNRQSSDPVTGDMLASEGPQPSEAEQATYQVLKAQLALIIKTLPPYAVAKLNGDQLEDLLISTKVQVQSDQYKGVMEEDEAGIQARIRAQQAAQASAARPAPQRTPSVSHTPYANQFQPGNQYGTPSRTPGMQTQFFRQGATPGFQQQQQRPMPPAQPRPPQPNQYTRTNGYPNQYATQLAKAQTPYGHQNMPQYANQGRSQFGQMPPQQGTPNTRYTFQQGFPQQPQATGTPTPGNYGAYTNGSAVPQRTMSPQVQHRQPYSPSPNMQHAQRYGTPNQTMGSQMNRFPSNPNQPGTPQQNTGPTGYHTVIPEAQQQRILDQAKARVAAQERSASFGDKVASQPSLAGNMPMGGGNLDMNRLAAARAGLAAQQKPQTPPGNAQRPGMNGTPGPHIPHKVTPVPVPVIPGLQAHRKPSS